MFELKIAVGAALSTALLAVVQEPESPLGHYTQLGLAGAALGIVFYLVAYTIPQIVKANLESERERTKMISDAMRESAKLNAEAVGTLGRELNDYASRMQDLLVQALHTPPPRA